MPKDIAARLVWTDFDPTRGREQAGRRPALVLSPAAFYRASRFVAASIPAAVLAEARAKLAALIEC